MRHYVALILLGIIFPGSIYCQLTPKIPNSQSPSGIRHGILDNGLTYYILKNDTVEKKVYLALVNKIGAFHFTEPRELGVPHFIEHMTMRSTRNFPDGLVNKLTSVGLKFGVDIRASTGESTNYDIRIPSRDSTMLNLGLMALHNASFGRNFDPAEVEQERQAIRNEMERGNLRSYEQLLESHYLLLNKNPLFDFVQKRRLENSNNNNISIASLREFEQRWYRPDLQAVVVVGDINEAEVETKVKELFSSLPNTTTTPLPAPDLRKKYDVKLDNRNALHVVNRGINGVLIKIIKKRKAVLNRDDSEVSRWHAKLQDEIYNMMVSRRIAKQVDRNSKRKFSKPAHFIERLAISDLAGIDGLVTQVEAPDLESAKESMRFAMTELKRISQWGLTESEFEVAKRLVKNAYQDVITTSGSKSLSLFLQQYFIDPSTLRAPNIQMADSLLSSISLHSINEMARSWLKEDMNVAILIGVQNDAAVNTIHEKEMLDWYHSLLKGKVRRYKNRLIKSPEQIAPPDTSNYTTSDVYEIGGTKLTLSNGITVIMKRLGPTDSYAKKGVGDIEIRGFRNGGVDLFKGVEQDAAWMAEPLIFNSGIGGLDDQALKNWLRSKNQVGSLSIMPKISYSETGIVGQATFNNAEDLFRLLFLYFAKPQRDKKVFKDLIEENRRRGKKRNFEDSVNFTIDKSIGKVPRKVVTEGDYRKSFEIYKELFANPREFTFVIAGYFDLDEITKLAVKYLGGLRNTRLKQFEHKDRPYLISPFQNDLRVTMVGDSTGNVDLRILIPGKGLTLAKDQLAMEVLNEIIKVKLHERLREKEGLVYSSFTGLVIARMEGYFSLQINFEVSPENSDRAINAVLNELALISQNGFDDRLMIAAKSIVNTRIRADLESQSYWTEYLTGKIISGQPLNDFSGDVDILKDLNRADVLNCAHEFIIPVRYSLFKQL